MCVWSLSLCSVSSAIALHERFVFPLLEVRLAVPSFQRLSKVCLTLGTNTMRKVRNDLRNCLRNRHLMRLQTAYPAYPTTCAMSSPKYSSLFLASPASSTERGSRSERREMEGMKEKRSVERRGDQAKETEEAARRSRQPVEKLSALPEDLHIFPFTSVERSASSASIG